MACTILAQRVDQKPTGSAISSPTRTCVCRLRPGNSPPVAEPVTDPGRIADFIELRLRRHPRMLGMILKSEGLPSNPSRLQLEDYARRLALVILHPDSEQDAP